MQGSLNGAVIILLNDNKTFKIQACYKGEYFTFLNDIKDEDTALLIKQAYCRGFLDAKDLYSQKEENK